MGRLTKTYLFFAVLSLIAALCILGSMKKAHAATCYGTTPCNACKNCHYCRHCSKLGGTCGVCSLQHRRPTKAPLKVSLPIKKVERK